MKMTARLVGLVTLGGLMMMGCARPAVVIHTPPELAGAAVEVDGAPIGHVGKTEVRYRWPGLRKLKEEFSGPPRSEASFEIKSLQPGAHVLRLSKPGFREIVRRFELGERKQVVIEITAADAVASPQPGSS
jgi:hypothetical protein